MNSSPVKIGIVAGEESGQLLGTELIQAIKGRLGERPTLIGVGGGQLEGLGLKSIFDPNEIALTGVSSVVKSLPRLLWRIGQTVDAIVEEKPDCLILIDSPDFSLRVARRVKSKLPNLPIIKYVSPTVWAWRPGRAAQMRAYIDHVLAILPFEPEVMANLGGPKTHYVGHRLMAEKALARAWRHNRTKNKPDHDELNVLLLPGSRTGEIKSLIGDFGEAIAVLEKRGHNVTVSIPTLPRHTDEVRRRTAAWRKTPLITTTREEQIKAYQKADAALAASGTITLELALAGVPAVSCYRVDPFIKLAASMITTWTGALPNLIADRPIIREFYNEQIRPAMLARCIEDMAAYGEPSRRAVMAGYKTVRNRMATDMPASEKAAKIVVDVLASDHAK